MKLLVTGGAGSSGRTSSDGSWPRIPEDSVVNLDKLTYAGNPANLADVEHDPRYAFVHGDICDAKLVRDVARGMDAIVNFAAPSHVDRSILDPDEFLRRPTCSACTCCWRRCGSCGSPRMLQISTDEVYGSIASGAAREDAPLQPSNPYSAAKAGGDLLALAAWRTHGVPVVITRSSNNFGPYQYPEKLVPLFVTNALEDRPLPLYGDGGRCATGSTCSTTARRSTLCCDTAATGEVYNIGGGHEVANLALTREILRLLDKPEGLIQPVADRPGHDRRYALDAAKVRQLGWAPRHPFLSALETTVRWYRAHRRPGGSR